MRTVNGKTAALRRDSARMRRLVTLLWAGSLTLVLLERFSSPTIRLVASGFAAEPLRRLLCVAAAAAPEIVLLSGVWCVRQALASFARGELFSGAIRTMLRRVGILLVAGSAARILVVPGVCRLLGFNDGYWIAFDAASLALAAIGAALTVISRVIGHAAALQSELDEIF